MLDREERDGTTCDIVDEESGEVVASNVCCPELIYGPSDRVTRANMILATPDLYAIVKGFIVQMRMAGYTPKLDSNHPGEDLLAKAIAALAKARGEK